MKYIAYCKTLARVVVCVGVLNERQHKQHLDHQLCKITWLNSLLLLFVPYEVEKLRWICFPLFPLTISLKPVYLSNGRMQFYDVKIK
jgi:hypothetical protein